MSVNSKQPVAEKRQVWDQQEDESDRDFKRFLRFLNPYHRSYAQIAVTEDRSLEDVEDLMIAYDWQGRAEAWDKHHASIGIDTKVGIRTPGGCIVPKRLTGPRKEAKKGGKGRVARLPVAPPKKPPRPTLEQTITRGVEGIQTAIDLCVDSLLLAKELAHYPPPEKAAANLQTLLVFLYTMKSESGNPEKSLDSKAFDDMSREQLYDFCETLRKVSGT